MHKLFRSGAVLALTILLLGAVPGVMLGDEPEPPTRG